MRKIETATAQKVLLRANKYRKKASDKTGGLINRRSSPWFS